MRRSILIAIFLLFSSISVAWANLPPAKEPGRNGTVPCGTVTCGTIPEPTGEPAEVTPTETPEATLTPRPDNTRVPTVYKLYLSDIRK